MPNTMRRLHRHMLLAPHSIRANAINALWGWLRLALCLVACFALGGCMPQDAHPPVARQGVLDLSQWNIERDGPVPLDGEWEVRWDQLRTPAQMRATEISGTNTPTQEYANIPGPWGQTRPGADFWHGTGVATFRLVVQHATGAELAALQLSNINSAYTLWVNGRLVGQSGTPGKNLATENARAGKDLFALGSDVRDPAQPLELVLQVSNQHYREGGVLSSLWFGSKAALTARAQRDMAIAMLLAGALLVMGVYHFALFYFRQSDRSPLLFGIYCLLWLGCYACTDSSGWAVRALLPNLPALGLERFGVICFAVSVPVGYAFFFTLYPRELSLRMLRVGAVVAGAFVLVAATGPFLLFRFVQPLYYLFTVVLIFDSLVRLYRAWRLGREGANFILGGFIILGGVGIHDMLADMRLINSVSVIAPGVLLFILSQAFALSQRLFRAFSAVETLSTQLESKNMSLEAEIEERGRLEREIINISEEERRRMSVDLHDGLCQLLTAARLRCAVLGGMPRSSSEKSELNNLSALLDELVDQAYDLSHGLWPLEHDPQSTGPSLADMIRRASRLSGVPITFTTQRGCESCPSANATQLFRIAQEALSNAVKHAAPQHIEVQYRCTVGGMAELTVRDDGVGRANAKPSKGGLGMGIMTHRARMIGGELRVEDAEGGGTIVCCCAPCDVTTSTKKRKRP